MEKFLYLTKEIGTKNNLEKVYKGLAELDSIQGNYKQAYEHYKLYILYRDSLVNEESKKKDIPDIYEMHEEVISNWSSYREEEKVEDAEEDDFYEVQKPIVNAGPKIGRNDPCPCGSGKKYKKCCLE